MTFKGFVLISYGTAPYVAYAWTVDQLLASAPERSGTFTAYKLPIMSKVCLYVLSSGWSFGLPGALLVDEVLTMS